MPNGSLTYRRGEIWWVNLTPVVGSETDKQRPCLILQNDLGNQKSSTTIVAPFIRGSKTYPYVVNVTPTEQNKLDGARYIHLGQMRSVDFQRIKNRLGILEDDYWVAIEKAASIELGFSVVFHGA
ncbi:MAG: type II toxin-antitoxin system PemK/MazF family toxin [Cyanobacteria bacterium P01_F01_bin.56]